MDSFIWDWSQLDQSSWQKLENTLPDDERSRVANFKSTKRQQEFIASRFLLRSSLEFKKLNHSEALSLAANGKPYFKNGPSVSIAHSDSFSFVAHSEQTNIGIDCQTHRDWTSDKIMQIVQNWESSLGLEYLKTLAADEARKQFFKVWTLKEAWVKNGNSIPESKNFYFTKNKVHNHTDSCFYYLFHKLSLAINSSAPVKTQIYEMTWDSPEPQFKKLDLEYTALV